MSIDLTTNYLGLKLANPLVASAGPLTGDLDDLKQLEAHGIAAAVMPSLFEEQIRHDQQQIQSVYDDQSFLSAESLSILPEIDDWEVGPEGYLSKLAAAAESVSIPVLGSLNGASPGGWTRYAKAMEETGAAAIELNVYYVPTDPNCSAEDVERQYVDLVASVRQSITIPLAVKLGAHFTSLPHFARQLFDVGADGLVLFNRYLEPDIDLRTLQVAPQLVLSSRHELRSPLRWISILRDQLDVSLAATSGVHRAEDVIKLLLVGADVAMMTTTLIQNGASYVAELLDNLRNWLEVNEYHSVKQLQGSMSYSNYSDPGELERANYRKALISFTSRH